MSKGYERTGGSLWSDMLGGVDRLEHVAQVADERLHDVDVQDVANGVRKDMDEMITRTGKLRYEALTYSNGMLIVADWLRYCASCKKDPDDCLLSEYGLPRLCEKRCDVDKICKAALALLTNKSGGRYERELQDCWLPVAARAERAGRAGGFGVGGL